MQSFYYKSKKKILLNNLQSLKKMQLFNELLEIWSGSGICMQLSITKFQFSNYQPKLSS